jgi:hypothetical protein
MVGERVVRIHDRTANCDAFWVTHPLPAGYVEPSHRCWLTVTPSNAKSGTYAHLDAGGFTPNDSIFGLDQLDGDLQPALIETDAAGEVHKPLSVYWKSGEGIIELYGDSLGEICHARVAITAVP